MTNLAIIQSVYAAFESGDFQTVLDLCDPDCSVTQDDALPWGGQFHGLDGVATFALALGAGIESTVSTEALYEAGDHVIQYGRSAGTVLASGATFDVPEVHVWKLREGKILSAEFYLDRAAMLTALGAAS